MRYFPDGLTQAGGIWRTEKDTVENIYEENVSIEGLKQWNHRDEVSKIIN